MGDSSTGKVAPLESTGDSSEVKDEEKGQLVEVKADREARSLRMQQWTWIEDESPARKVLIEEALDRFAAFQFPDTLGAPADEA